MTAPRMLRKEAKERVVWAAQQLMLRAGLQVTEIRDGDRVTIDVFIPPDSKDPCGDALVRVLES